MSHFLSDDQRNALIRVRRLIDELHITHLAFEMDCKLFRKRLSETLVFANRLESAVLGLQELLGDEET